MQQRPPHPGEVLRDLMRSRCITVADLVRAGMSEEYVNLLLRRLEELHRNRPGEIATLARITGTTSKFWMDVQNKWFDYSTDRWREARKSSR